MQIQFITVVLTHLVIISFLKQPQTMVFLFIQERYRANGCFPSNLKICLPCFPAIQSPSVSFLVFPFTSCQHPRKKTENRCKRRCCHTMHTDPSQSKKKSPFHYPTSTLRAIIFKEHFSDAPSPARRVSMANLISNVRGQEA